MLLLSRHSLQRQDVFRQQRDVFGFGGARRFTLRQEPAGDEQPGANNQQNGEREDCQPLRTEPWLRVRA